MPTLSVLVPVYNESKTIRKIIEDVRRVDIDKEIILVDDCSTDGTRRILDEYYGSLDRVKIIYHKKNQGKGAAVKTALEYAKGDYSIIQDGDLEYDPKDYKLLLRAALAGGADIVYGSRFLKTWRCTSLPHFIVNRALTMATNILYGSKLTDMETCYKLIRTDIFKALRLRSDRFDIEPEITARLLRKGCKIIEEPISYKGRPYHEGKKITWKDGFMALWTLLRFRI
ncbi:MAG: glycosyltransferase family 2 protein [Candidatus Omnitrophica bacterium]|nr:glycosyltransferase family 2 protein [Candidatus Omnitrophota bacterium]